MLCDGTKATRTVFPLEISVISPVYWFKITCTLEKTSACLTDTSKNRLLMNAFHSMLSDGERSVLTKDFNFFKGFLRIAGFLTHVETLCSQTSKSCQFGLQGFNGRASYGTRNDQWSGQEGFLNIPVLEHIDLQQFCFNDRHIHTFFFDKCHFVLIRGLHRGCYNVHGFGLWEEIAVM